MPDGGGSAHEPSDGNPTADFPSWFPLDGNPLYNNPALFDLAHRGYRGDISWYRAAIGTGPAQVMDLGCGTGRLALPLADAGHHLIGVDDNEVMLDVLRTRIQPHQTIGLINADARQLDLDVQVDVVLAACNFLGHFSADERRAILRRSSGWLRPGGKLLLDLADAAWHREHPELRRLVAYRDETGSTYAVTAASSAHHGHMIVAFAIHAVDAGGDLGESLVQGSVDLHLIAAEDLRRELEEAGFVIDQWLCEFAPGQAETAGHRVVVAARRV